MAGCSFSSPDQCVSDLATSALGQMAKSFADSASYALTKCTEVWLRIPSPDVTSGSSPSVWLSSQLNAFVLAVMFVSVLYSAYRMATSGTFDHVGELGKSLARLFVVSGVVGVATTTGLSMGDAVANWMLTGTRAHLGTLVVITPAMSPALSVILSATVIIGAVVQAVLMLIKNAMVVILVGFMPLTSAATNTPVGQGSFLKALTWLAAMVAYKPVAAIIYALAFKLSDRRQDMAAQLSGIAFMVLAIVALPALMRFLAPVAAAATGGSAGAISGAIVGGTVATGAVIGAGLITGGGGFAAAAPAAMSAAPSGAQTGAAPAATGTTTTEPDQGSSSMTEAQSAVTDRATYGNFIAQRSPGLLGAGLIGTAVLFGGIVCALLALLAAGIEAALIVAGLGVLTFTITGTPVGAWAARRIGYGRARFAGDTMHRSGIVARDSSGVWRSAMGEKPVVHRTRLPGMLAQTAVLESVDGFGRRFAVVRSTGGLYSITARCSAEGPSMQDQEQVDRWVAGWSTVLNSAGQESGLQCLKAITASEPDPGGRLPAMVANLRADSSPELADAVMAECVATLPATSSEVSTYVELTYRGRFLSRRGDQTAILAELARKVPGLVAMLQTAGGGSVEMVTPEDLAALVRAAYDPAAAAALEQAELDGLPGPTWEEAGPVAYHETWSDLTHDSGRSVTWEMQQPPRSSITENALAGLLKPHPDFARKRVALIYRPHTPDESTRVAERDSTTANFVAQQGKKRPSAAAQRVQRAAEQSRQEVAAGAAAIRFSLLVTVTVRPDQDAPQAVSTLEASGRGVPIRLRRVYGSQAAGFAATLPVGFVPHLHTVVPSSVRGVAVTARWRVMPTPPEYRGTSVQTCGLWPMAAGSSRPNIGVPIGPDLVTGATVCCDPFSWFRAGFISSPSMAVFGLPGLGKSSFAGRQIIGLAHQGVASLVTDLKAEYSPLVRALGGQVMEFGKGYRLNLLDLGAMGDAARRIGGSRGQALRELAVGRVVDAVSAQVQIVRRLPVADWEVTLLTTAVWALDVAFRRRRLAPTWSDLVRVVHSPTDGMLTAVLAQDAAAYQELTTGLQRSLQAVLEGPLGRLYDGQTTDRLRTDAPAVSIDISAISRQSESTLASVMLASWGETFAAVEAANALTDAGLTPQRNYLVVLDELWRPMRLEGAGLVDKVDSITRLNRADGVGNIFVTHSLRDLQSMSSEADNRKAAGFAERSGIVVTAGLAKEDLRALSEIKRMSEVEISTVAGWSTPPGWRARTVRSSKPAPPPGAGKVLIKLGERAGIPAQVRLTRTELELHDTNSRWDGAA